MIREKSKQYKQVIDLDGPDGNAFVLMGTARSVLRKVARTTSVKWFSKKCNQVTTLT